MERLVAVIAGTPVDTSMGVEYLRKKNAGLKLLAYPACGSPRECHLFEMASLQERRRGMDRIFDDAEERGVLDFFVYCNSLSACFDFGSYALERGVRIVTPFTAYRKLAPLHKKIALIAANSQGTAGIERVINAANPEASVFGYGALPIVAAIEAGKKPDDIARELGLAELCRCFEISGAECLVLGCTHFPYIRPALEKLTGLPIVDPADTMYEELRL